MALIALLAALGAPRLANAGCGCDKPPPPPAQLRPNVAYAGAPVSIFAPWLRVGDSFTVTFTSGITGESASVGGQVVSRRDLADATVKPQLVVPLPALPLGPASITVTANGAAAPAITVPDTSFTVAPTPIGIPTTYGAWHYPSYQAAVGRDGTAYVALDLTGITEPMVFEAQAAGYPLRFGAGDVVFRNIQGFLMQLIVQNTGATAGQPVPGMFVFPAANPATDSDSLHYSRHEFSTYFLQHQERQPHAVDPTDGNWHLDGSRHVDHDHLILTITGKLNGTTPPPGATPPFDLVMRTYTLFYEGIVGENGIDMSGSASTDSLDTDTMKFGAAGDVYTNGQLGMSGKARINGSAMAGKYNTGPTVITGTKSVVTAPMSFMSIKVPTGIPDLGVVNLKGTTMSINTTGSFRLASLTVGDGARIYIDNTSGPVTLYVLGGVTVSGTGSIAVADPRPEKFAIYVASNKPVNMNGGASFYGVVYAPDSPVSITGNAAFTGAFVGDTLKMSNMAVVHYDSTLRGN